MTKEEQITWANGYARAWGIMTLASIGVYLFAKFNIWVAKKS